MPKTESYYQESQAKYRQKKDALLPELPEFCRRYFRAREARLSEKTAYVYAHNFRVFFNEYLGNNSDFYRSMIRRDNEGSVLENKMSLNEMANISTDDIDEYLHWLTGNGNSRATLSHHLSALSSLWKFFIVRGFLEKNPVDGVDRFHEKKEKIIRLENDEKPRFLYGVENGSGLSGRQALFHEKNRERDCAIIYLLISTGIRVSELVGLTVDDINYREHSIDIYRKGGKYQRVYMSDECESKLAGYIEIREAVYKPDESEKALFLSRSGKRLSVRSVEILVKKYAASTLPDKVDAVTPHKLRATFATWMYRETGDIGLVAELMGHESMQTTRLYADQDAKRHKDVRNII